MQEFLHFLYNNPAKGLFLFDSKFKLIDYNPAAVRLRGFSKKTMKDKDLKSIGLKLGLKETEIIHHKAQIINNDIPIPVETFVNRKSGICFFSINYELNFKKSTFDSFILCAQEIQSRQNNDRELISDFITHLQDFGQTIIYSIKFNGNDFIHDRVSKNVTKILGYEVSEVLKPDWWFKHIFPADRENIYKKFSFLFEFNDLMREYRFLTKDGKVIWLLDVLRLERNIEGIPIGAIGYWTDISDIKLKEQLLAESEEKYYSLFNDALDMIHIVDMNKIIVDVNKIELETLGYSKDELVGKNLLDIIHPNQRLLVKNNINNLLKGNKIMNERICFLTKKGNKIFAEINVSPKIENGKIVSLRTISRNITERLKIENEVLEKTKKIEQAQKIAKVG